MDKHHDIARGYVKGDKVVVDSLWTELTALLNSSGPPSKTCKEWKKVWSDWKGNVKAKMCHNKKDLRGTGGGDINQYVFSEHENSLIRICGLYKSVDGVGGAVSFADFVSELDFSCSEKENFDSSSSTHIPRTRKSSQLVLSESENEELNFSPSTSKQTTSILNKKDRPRSCIPAAFKNVSTLAIDPRTPTLEENRSRTPIQKRLRNKSLSCSPPSTPIRQVSGSLTKAKPTPAVKRPRARTPSKQDLNALLVEENSHLQNLEKICKILEDNSKEMKKQTEKLDRLCNILEKKYVEEQLHNIEMQKRMRERNEMKLKIVELETLKYAVEQEKANTTRS